MAIAGAAEAILAGNLTTNGAAQVLLRFSKNWRRPGLYVQNRTLARKMPQEPTGELGDELSCPHKEEGGHVVIVGCTGSRHAGESARS
jgi:hypothetical protein